MDNTLKRFLFFLGCGMLAIVILHFAIPRWNEHKHKSISDAKVTKGAITVAKDSWVGYFPLCSSEMRKLMHAEGWIWKCEDDGADYQLRMQHFKDRSIDFAVATVDTDILNAAPKGFPGVEIMVIDESKGSDAMVAWEEFVKNIDDIKGRSDLPIAFSPNSPSHYLLKGIAAHFGVPELLPTDKRRIETNGSSEALKKFLAHDAKLAVLWQPDVSRALKQKGVVKVIGTEVTRHFIVDILMVERSFAEVHPDVVALVLQNYFRTLKTYRDDPPRLRQEIMAENTDLNEDEVKTMLSGLVWATLDDNCRQWFGVSPDGSPVEQGLIDTIESTVKILIANKDFSSNPIPNEDSYRLINSDYIRQLCTNGISGFTVPGGQNPNSPDSLQKHFTTLDDEGWNSLRDVGTLKIPHIVFRAGTAEFTDDKDKSELSAIADTISHYPTFWILIEGHTGIQGNKDANKVLSQARAEIVRDYLFNTFRVDPNRMRAVGYGSEKPLPRLSGESVQRYNYRMPRVEISMRTEVY